MKELKREKSFSARDPKFNQAKQQIKFDKSKSIKFTCSCNCSQFDGRIIIYLGLTNGSIVAITLYKQRTSFTKYEDFTVLSCYEQFKHKGPISALISETIDSTPVVFSGGADGGIKLWLGDPELREKEMVHHIKTLLEHKSTIISLAFCRTRSLLISSSSDMSMKVFRMKDKFDKILNPRFECINTIRDFHIKLNKDKDLPYWISTLSIKETDIIELYAGDTKGRVLFYHYIDDNYLKYKGSSGHALELEGINKNNFNFLYAVNLHKKWGTIKVVHSAYDNVIYSAGFNNHIVCYNIKNQQKIFEVANSNSKTYFSSLIINNLTQELIIGDDIGNITFIQIYNKSEFKTKAMNNKINSIQSLELFPDQEHILLVSEDSLNIFRVLPKTKVSNAQHHNNEIIKLIVIEPITILDKIIEDTKIISCAYDNMIKIWDFLTMECINKINGPELPKKNLEVTTMCYLADSGLIAVGTNVGHVFFWDLSKSQYLPLTYEKVIRHKGSVTDMMTYIDHGKENNDNVECVLSCGVDGSILLWEIMKTEIKQSNKKYNYEEIEEMIVKKENEMKENDSNKNSKNTSKIRSNLQNENINQNQSKVKNTQNIIKKSYQELKNFNCSPTIKRNFIAPKCEFNSIAYQPQINKNQFYAGANDYCIYVWDMIKSKYIKITSKNKKISRLIFDKNFLISSGDKGVIEIWNTPLKEGENNLLSEILDPDKKGQNDIRINDILMLNKYGLLVSCNNYKKIHFWKYEEIPKQQSIQLNQEDKKDKTEGKEQDNKKEKKNEKDSRLKYTITKDNEVMCLACDENYGKLLCGTREKIIMEIDIVEELKSILEKNYERYEFLKNSANYKEDEIDKKIDNFKIMKSLTQGVGQ